MNISVKQRRNILEERYYQWPRHTIAEHFKQVCKQYGDSPFLHINDNSLTYNQMWSDAEAYAKNFIAMGVKERDHIAVLMNNDMTYPALMIATSMVGAVFIPINSMLTKLELKYILAQSDTKYLFVQQTLKDKNHGIAITQLLEDENFVSESKLNKVILLENYRQEQVSNSFHLWKQFITYGNNISNKLLYNRFALSKFPNDIAIIMYTSGSTGNPKGVMLTSDMLLRCGYGTCLSRAIEDGRVTLAPLPFYHCFAIIEAIFAMSFVGGSIISAFGASPIQTLELMEKYRVNDYLCVPSMLIPLLNHPKIKEFDLSQLFAMWCGAAPAPVSVWEKAQNLLGLTEIITGYGQTEVSSSGVTTEIGVPLKVLSTRVGRPKLGGKSGVPEFDYAAVQYKTIDIDTLKDLPSGELGELVVRGNTVTRGYYNKPLETAETIDKDGWLRTGDVGEIDEQGYLKIVGRSKEIFKVSGELVAPREVENVIYKHPDVNMVQVIGVPDKITTEIGAVFIELNDNANLMRKDIYQYCADKLAKFKLPRHIWFINKEDWPMTSTGKIKKFHLKAMAKEKLGRR